MFCSDSIFILIPAELPFPTNINTPSSPVPWVPSLCHLHTTTSVSWRFLSSSSYYDFLPSMHTLPLVSVKFCDAHGLRCSMVLALCSQPSLSPSLPLSLLCAVPSACCQHDAVGCWITHSVGVLLWSPVASLYHHLSMALGTMLASHLHSKSLTLSSLAGPGPVEANTCGKQNVFLAVAGPGPDTRNRILTPCTPNTSKTFILVTRTPWGKFYDYIIFKINKIKIIQSVQRDITIKLT